MSTIGSVDRLCQYSRVLQERWEGCAGTGASYKRTGETEFVLVHHSIIRALGR